MRAEKIKGKKRHLLVDTLGLLLHAIVHPADIQDRDGGILLLATLFGMYPFLKKLFADGGYQGPEFHTALTKLLPQLETEIIKRSAFRQQRPSRRPHRWLGQLRHHRRFYLVLFPTFSVCRTSNGGGRSL